MSSDLRIPDMNKVFLAGRLTRDPELRFIQSGTALCKIGLAVSRKYRTKDGDQKEDVVFVDVTCWGKTAEYVGENFRKGHPVIVEGRLKGDEWEDKESGQKRTKIGVTADRIQALEWEERGGSKQPAPREDVEEQPPPEDDIPF